MTVFVCVFLAAILGAPVAPQDPAQEQRVAQLQSTLGDSYRTRLDEPRKIAVLSDLPVSTVDGHLDTLRRYEDALHRTFFEHLPDYWILVVIPANADDYARKLGGKSGIAGFYDAGSRTLTVNIATGGGTLVHEWTHAMNVADQTARGQFQPLWILEGFGSLYEQVGISNDRPVGYTNWRLPMVQDLIQTGALIPMREFITGSSKYFDKDPGAATAEARYIFYYLQEKGLLQSFYRTYVEGYAADRTGIVALEKVLGKRVEDWVGEWKEFTNALTFGNAPPRPRIGIQIDAANGALRVINVIEGSGADSAGLKAEDVIVGMDGESVSSVEDLQKVLASRKRGEVATLRVRRDGAVQDVKVTLR